MAGQQAGERAKDDFRIEVLEALLGIVENTPLVEVKPEDVCRACGISRSTFYRYFSGVQDVAAWFQRYTSELGIHAIGRTLTCVEGHLVSLSMLEHARNLYKGYVLWWNGDFSPAAVRNHIDAMTEVYRERGIAVDRQTEYEMEGAASACHHVVSRWMNDGCDLPVDQMAQTMASFYPVALRQVFDKPARPREALGIVLDLLDRCAAARPSAREEA